MEETIEEIKKAIYWNVFTDKQKKAIMEIINQPEMNNMGRANDICDYLGIERRGNRREIAIVLNNKKP